MKNNPALLAKFETELEKKFIAQLNVSETDKKIITEAIQKIKMAQSYRLFLAVTQVLNDVISDVSAEDFEKFIQLILMEGIPDNELENIFKVRFALEKNKEDDNDQTLDDALEANASLKEFRDYAFKLRHYYYLLKPKHDRDNPLAYRENYSQTLLTGGHSNISLYLKNPPELNPVEKELLGKVFPFHLLEEDKTFRVNTHKIIQLSFEEVQCFFVNICRRTVKDKKTPNWEDLFQLDPITAHDIKIYESYTGGKTSEEFLKFTVEKLEEIELSGDKGKYTKAINYATRDLLLSSMTDLVKIKKLLKWGAEANHKNNNGLTALHLACSRNIQEKEEIVKALLEAGADPDIYDEGNYSPLYVACDTANETPAQLAIIKMLLQKSKNPFDQNNRYKNTPAHAAARRGSYFILEIFKNYEKEKNTNFLNTLLDKFGKSASAVLLAQQIKQQEKGLKLKPVTNLNTNTTVTNIPQQIIVPPPTLSPALVSTGAQPKLFNLNTKSYFELTTEKLNALYLQPTPAFPTQNLDLTILFNSYYQQKEPLKPSNFMQSAQAAWRQNKLAYNSKLKPALEAMTNIINSKSCKSVKYYQLWKKIAELAKDQFLPDFIYSLFKAEFLHQGQSFSQYLEKGYDPLELAINLDEPDGVIEILTDNPELWKEAFKDNKLPENLIIELGRVRIASSLETNHEKLRISLRDAFLEETANKAKEMSRSYVYAHSEAAEAFQIDIKKVSEKNMLELKSDMFSLVDQEILKTFLKVKNEWVHATDNINDIIKSGSLRPSIEVEKKVSTPNGAKGNIFFAFNGSEIPEFRKYAKHFIKINVDKAMNKSELKPNDTVLESQDCWSGPHFSASFIARSEAPRLCMGGTYPTIIRVFHTQSTETELHKARKFYLYEDNQHFLIKTPGITSEIYVGDSRGAIANEFVKTLKEISPLNSGGYSDYIYQNASNVQVLEASRTFMYPVNLREMKVTKAISMQSSFVEIVENPKLKIKQIPETIIATLTQLISSKNIESFKEQIQILVAGEYNYQEGLSKILITAIFANLPEFLQLLLDIGCSIQFGNNLPLRSAFDLYFRNKDKPELFSNILSILEKLLFAGSKCLDGTDHHRILANADAFADLGQNSWIKESLKANHISFLKTIIFTTQHLQVRHLLLKSAFQMFNAPELSQITFSFIALFADFESLMLAFERNGLTKQALSDIRKQSLMFEDAFIHGAPITISKDYDLSKSRYQPEHYLVLSLLSKAIINKNQLQLQHILKFMKQYPEFNNSLTNAFCYQFDLAHFAAIYADEAIFKILLSELPHLNLHKKSLFDGYIPYQFATAFSNLSSLDFLIKTSTQGQTLEERLTLILVALDRFMRVDKNDFIKFLKSFEDHFLFKQSIARPGFLGIFPSNDFPESLYQDRETIYTRLSQNNRNDILEPLIEHRIIIRDKSKRNSELLKLLDQFRMLENAFIFSRILVLQYGDDIQKGLYEYFKNFRYNNINIPTRANFHIKLAIELMNLNHGHSKWLLLLLEYLISNLNYDENQKFLPEFSKKAFKYIKYTENRKSIFAFLIVTSDDYKAHIQKPYFSIDECIHYIFKFGKVEFLEYLLSKMLDQLNKAYLIKLLINFNQTQEMILTFLNVLQTFGVNLDSLYRENDFSHLVLSIHSININPDEFKKYLEATKPNLLIRDSSGNCVLHAPVYQKILNYEVIFNYFLSLGGLPETIRNDAGCSPLDILLLKSKPHFIKDKTNLRQVLNYYLPKVSFTQMTHLKESIENPKFYVHFDPDSEQSFFAKPKNSLTMTFKDFYEVSDYAALYAAHNNTVERSLNTYGSNMLIYFRRPSSRKKYLDIFKNTWHLDYEKISNSPKVETEGNVYYQFIGGDKLQNVTMDKYLRGVFHADHYPNEAKLIKEQKQCSNKFYEAIITQNLIELQTLYAQLLSFEFPILPCTYGVSSATNVDELMNTPHRSITFSPITLALNLAHTPQGRIILDWMLQQNSLNYCFYSVDDFWHQIYSQKCQTKPWDMLLKKKTYADLEKVWQHLKPVMTYAHIEFFKGKLAEALLDPDLTDQDKKTLNDFCKREKLDLKNRLILTIEHKASKKKKREEDTVDKNPAPSKKQKPASKKRKKGSSEDESDFEVEDDEPKAKKQTSQLKGAFFVNGGEESRSNSTETLTTTTTTTSMTSKTSSQQN